MSKTVKAHGLMFEDWVEDKEFGDWANICNEHAKHINRYYLDDSGQSDDCLCSVDGCQNKSDYYVNLYTLIQWS